MWSICSFFDQSNLSVPVERYHSKCMFFSSSGYCYVLHVYQSVKVKSFQTLYIYLQWLAWPSLFQQYNGMISILWAIFGCFTWCCCFVTSTQLWPVIEYVPDSLDEILWEVLSYEFLFGKMYMIKMILNISFTFVKNSPLHLFLLKFLLFVVILWDFNGLSIFCYSNESPVGSICGRPCVSYDFHDARWYNFPLEPT